MFEQVIQCGRSAWFLTANDDFGGGTFPVIDALKDRIDLVVRCTPFHSQYLQKLTQRVADGRSAEEILPADIVFTAAEMEEADRAIREIPVPADVLNCIGFLLSQLDFCQRASPKLEYKNKDTLHLAGRRLGHVCNEDCPLDKQENLCTQTENGVSARAYQSLIHFSKAMAYFRKKESVSAEDVRELLPWILHDKLQPNPQSAFFQKNETRMFLVDRVSWVRQLFERALRQYAAYVPVRQPILQLIAESESGRAGLTAAEVQKRMEAVKRQIETILQKSEFNGAVYEDLLLLKRLYSGYQSGNR